ncbi:cobalamin-binding protein [Alteromonas sp. CYL-A6]|uniref:cobalamin-binding protein n=1 Tax=Alteromonas nitratireducens TaxID=3390813 RepID=UPI0034BC96A6
MRVIWLALLLLISAPVFAEQRIVTLAPHLTEWVYSLNAGDSLVAVSDYSDYPEAAKALPRVADYQGVDFTAIAALAPTLILAWEGGNRPQDIARLKSLGFDVFATTIRSPEDIATHIISLGEKLNRSDLARDKAAQFLTDMHALAAHYAERPRVTAFYYSWTAPLMSVGPHAWASTLLSVCGADTAFADSPVDYPQVSVEQVLRRQPDILISATARPLDNEQAFWRPHRAMLTSPLIQTNPDIMSRFTLRLPTALGHLCQQIDTVR